jgi:hypothetical protein
MSFTKKCCSALAVAGALLLVTSCAEGPTLPPDDGEVGPVLKKGGGKGGGPPQVRDVDVEIRSDFAGNALIGDGLGLYEGGKCGALAVRSTNFYMRPFDGGMNKKEMRDFEESAECGRNPDSTAVRRWMSVDLSAARVHRICKPGDADFDPSLEACPNDHPVSHDGELTLAQMIANGDLDSIVGSGFDHGHVYNAGVGSINTTDGLSRGSFRVVYCGAASHPLKFDASRFPGSNDVWVDNSDTTNVHIETQPGPHDNVGLCAHYDATWDGDSETQTPLVLLLHLDFAYDVIDQQ